MPRPQLHQILCTAFFNKKDSPSQKRCQQKSVKMVNEGRYNEIFDGYPLLICEADLAALSYRFIDILVNINENETVISDKKLLTKVDVLLSDIAKLGAAELFNSYGHMNAAMLLVMGLTEHQDQLKGKELEILSGYVITVMQEIHFANEEDTEHHPVQLGILMQTLRLRCKSILEKEIKNPDRDINLRDWKAETINRIPSYIKEHPLETALLFGTVGILGTFAFFSGKLIESYVNSAPAHKFEL